MFSWHDTPWMWISMLVFWSIFAFVVYQAVSGRGRGGRSAVDGPSRAAGLLDERYARGEISADEYRERRETLDRTAASGDGG